MQYFTRAWASGALSDAEWEAAEAAYVRRLAEISPRLPPDLRTLSRISLNDALFKQVTVDRQARRFLLRLRCGDLQQGYFDLVLDYDNAEVLDHTPHGCAALVDTAGVEVVYDEIDELGPGSFEHRLLLWPEGEIFIRCTGLALARTPVPSRAAP